jgi:carbon monoxide dehydrogenase subunit G
MKLEQSFEVAAPVERVWETLIDLEQVAPCLPGAAITGHDEEGTYHGTFQVKLGPTTASYRGTIRIEEKDEENHTATMAAKGSDKRGQGGASATIVNTLHPMDDGGTRVDAVTDFTITGRLASFGRGGMIKDISNRLLRDFASCLQQRLAGELEPAAAEPAGAAALAPSQAAAGASTMTAGEAAASAGAETRPEESAAAASTGAQPPGTPGAAPSPGAPPPPAAAPVKAHSLLLSVLGDRLKALAAFLLARVKALAPVIVARVKALIGQARARRSG